MFQDSIEVQALQARMAECAHRNGRKVEFKYSKTKERLKDCFFECTAPVNCNVRAISVDKSKIYSPKLRESPSALKSYAIRRGNRYGRFRAASRGYVIINHNK